MKEEALARHFRSNNSEYINIIKTVEEKVPDMLSNRKALLNLAVLCITDSIKEDSEKYSYLVQDLYRHSRRNSA
jgi:chaperonin cofactor prefoldin